jgi:hypothetical protein
MSELDNTKSKDILGMSYTPLPDYLAELITYFKTNPMTEPLTYRRRRAELQFINQLS